MNEKRSVQRCFAVPFGLWAVLFIVLPLLFVIWHGLTDGAGGFSLEAVQMALQPEYLRALGLSVELALVTR